MSGRVAIVTGAGGGIGLGIVSAFVDAGARVLATVRRDASIAEIEMMAPGAQVLVADLSDPTSVSKIVPTCVQRLGQPDILINNAALLDPCPLTEISSAYIDEMIAVNLKAPLLLCSHFAASWKPQGRAGKIINIGSIEGYVATMPSGLGAYSASKTALRGMTVSLARELGPLGIGVNAIAPGGVVHGNLAKADQPQRTGPEVQAVLDGIRDRSAVGRFGTPEDIASLCLFLASEASDYIAGQIIVADGGYSVA